MKGWVSPTPNFVPKWARSVSTIFRRHDKEFDEPLLSEIDHVAIAVNDLDAAITWYEEVFGASVVHREVVDSDGVSEALIRVADSYIQLLTPTRPDSPVAKYLEKKGEGLAPRGLPRHRLRGRARVASWRGRG